MDVRIKSILRSPALAMLVAISIPVVISALFHLSRPSYPHWDEAEYLRLSLKHAQTFRSDGILAGLKSVYTDRLWKPIFQSAIGVVPMLISQGGVIVGAALAELGLYAMLLSFTFLTANLFLSPWLAGLCSVILGLNPLLLGHSHAFGAQMSFLAFWAATVYFIVRWYLEGLRGWAIAGGFFLGLAAMVRPIETFLIGIFPATYLIASFAKHPKRRLDLALSLGAGFLLVSVWFIPYFGDLYYWVRGCSLSQHMKTVWGRTDGDFLQFIGNMITKLFGISGLVLLVGAGLAVRRWSWWLLILALACTLPLVAGGLSTNGSYWFFYNSMYSGTLVLLILCLGKSGSLRWLRILSVIALSAFLSRSAFTAIAPHELSFSEHYLTEPCVFTGRMISNQLDVENPTKISVLYYQGSKLMGLDPWCLDLYSLEHGWKVRFTIGWDGADWQTFDWVMKNLRDKEMNYLLVGPLGQFSISRKDIAMVSYVKELEDRDQNNTLSELGLSRRGYLPMPLQYPEMGTALLMSVNPKRP